MNYSSTWLLPIEPRQIATLSPGRSSHLRFRFDTTAGCRSTNIFIRVLHIQLTNFNSSRYQKMCGAISYLVFFFLFVFRIECVWVWLSSSTLIYYRKEIVGEIKYITYIILYSLQLPNLFNGLSYQITTNHEKNKTG